MPEKTEVETPFAKLRCQALIPATSASAENSLVFGHHFG
jgi:hypothetical protein